MLAAYANQEEFSAFSASREHLDDIIHTLLSPALAAQEHGDIEGFIQKVLNHIRVNKWNKTEYYSLVKASLQRNCTHSILKILWEFIQNYTGTVYEQ